ncbi:MAG: HD domain-containing protein [Lachnospiraceae bacterium]|nr:HD domain-containing protein [Lachnospiraceae bacterium]
MRNSVTELYDRLYNHMKFPPIIVDLLDCPGLLRLRDVRMANNQFVAFPAFANSSRYEHSLGVCYLAGICADKLGLPEKDKIELMMAGLYHDVGTPPFAHAMEEVLMAQFGFDHEQNLKNLIIGDTGDFDQDLAQIYIGQSLKLKSVCQSKKARQLGIDSHRIAKLAIGDKSDGLSALINGSGMDLDNIDNICRAVSAMGFVRDKVDFSQLAIDLASSFVLRNGKIYYNDRYASQIEKWLLLRDMQYTEIYQSVDDFAYQSMIKKAIRLFGESDKDHKLEKNLWRLTDSEFTYQYLLANSESRTLMERVLLCRPYPLLALLYVRGKGSIKYINTHIREIEERVGSYLSTEYGFERYKKEDLVLANFYPDKRHRWIPKDRWIGQGNVKYGEHWDEGAILGFFTSSKVVGYVTNSDTKRYLRRFDNKNIPALIKEVQKLFKDFEVMEYGKEKRGIDTTINDEGQLGFWGL